jgi:primary-amine oxidase
VEKQDVVVWYAMHVHHLPRTENWPQMPVEWAGFEIVPRDFLDRAPINAVKEPQ